MSDFADVKPHPIMGARDVAAQYAGLETRVGGIEKTVDNLSRYMRDENSALRREMADQNAATRHEMASQNATVIAAIDKLTQTAAASNASVRTEFATDLQRVADKQGIKSGTLIALGTLILGALAFFISQNNKPMEMNIADLKMIVAKMETDFVPRAQIDKMQAQLDRHETQIVPREENDREQALRNRIYELTEKVRDVSAAAAAKDTDIIRSRTGQRLDDLDNRLRDAEQTISSIEHPDKK